MCKGHGGGRWLVVLFALALVVPALPAQTVRAATRTVDSLSDTAVDAGHCTDAIAGNCTLRDSIQAALPNDTITFGSLTGRITLAAARGPLVLASNVTIQGPGRDLLFIDGGCTTCDSGGTRSNGVRVFTVNSGVTATINGVTITKGRAGTDYNDGGGGVLNNGTLTVVDSAISGNATSNATAFNGAEGGGGGGIANFGTLTVTGSTISGNSTGSGITLSGGGITNGGNGGGIYNRGVAVTMTGSTISDNSTGRGGDGTNGNGGNGGDGGGIYNYYGTLTITGSTITSNTAGGGGSGTTVANDGSTNRGGKGGGIYHISNGPSLTITNSTISSNRAGDSGTYNDHYGFVGSPGGGIYNAGPATVTGTTLSSNSAGSSNGFGGTGGDGGGIYNIGTLTLTGSTLMSNYSGSGSTGHSQNNSFGPGGNGGNGGGIANGSLNYGFSDSNHGTLTMTGGTLSNNSTGSGGNGGGGTSGGNSGGGGGIFSNGTFTMTGVTVSTNSTGSGGALGSAGSGTGGNGGDGGGILAYSGDFTIAGSILTGNATGSNGGTGGRRGEGGGIYDFGVTLVVQSSSLDHNTALFGGGVWNANGATLVLTGSTITNNATGDGASGGGLYNESDATVANSTFSGNTATYGAGIMNAPPTGKTFTLRNDTIANNTASRVGGGDSKGGGLYQNSGALDIGNTLLTANTAAGATYDYHDGTGGVGVTSRGHNFIRSAAGNFPVQSSDITGNTQTVIAPLADNGGTTTLPDGSHPKTDALLPSCSPANVCPLDNGDATMCAASPVSNVDGRGLPRPPPGRCDIGAYEVQPNVLPSVHPSAPAGPAPAPLPARSAGSASGSTTPLPLPTRRT